METIAAGFVLGVVLIGSGSGIWWIARRTSSGDLARNALAGIRTTATMSSDAAWIAAHKRAEGPTVAAGASCLASGVVAVLIAILLALGAVDESLASPLLLAIICAGTVALLGLTAYGGFVGNREAKRINEHQSRPPKVQP